MSDVESFEDTIDSAGRMVEAGRLFSRASVRALEFLGTIGAARQTVEKTMPHGKEALEMENVETVLDILSDTKLSKIFKDPAAMIQGQYREFAKNITEKSIASASSLVAAGSLVFAHGVFDATLFDYCRVSALWVWKDWLELVNKRKVSIAEVEQATKYRVLLRCVDDYLAQLERESILKKADVLHQVIKPGNYQTTVRNYAYSRERLELIDRARHDAVHRLRFREGFGEIDDTIDYLRKTVVHFMGLLHRRYGLQIDPNVNTDADASAAQEQK
jgi:hypothetical protein